LEVVGGGWRWLGSGRDGMGRAGLSRDVRIEDEAGMREWKWGGTGECSMMRRRERC